MDQALAAFYEESIKQTLKDTKGLRELALRQWIERELITAADTRGMVDEGDKHTKGIPTEAKRSVALVNSTTDEFVPGTICGA